VACASYDVHRIILSGELVESVPAILYELCPRNAQSVNLVIAASLSATEKASYSVPQAPLSPILSRDAKVRSKWAPPLPYF
jgi:hypothetical protein